VEVLPADAVMPVDRAGATAGDAMPNALYAAELLGSRCSNSPGRSHSWRITGAGLERLQPIEPEAAQHARHRRTHLRTVGLLTQKSVRDLRDRLSSLDMAGHLESTVGRGARILVNVHPGLRPGLLTVGSHQFLSSAPGEQPSQQSQLVQ
jgi:hypothetical protein